MILITSIKTHIIAIEKENTRKQQHRLKVTEQMATQEHGLFKEIMVRYV